MIWLKDRLDLLIAGWEQDRCLEQDPLPQFQNANVDSEPLSNTHWKLPEAPTISMRETVIFEQQQDMVQPDA